MRQDLIVPFDESAGQLNVPLDYETMWIDQEKIHLTCKPQQPIEFDQHFIQQFVQKTTEMIETLTDQGHVVTGQNEKITIQCTHEGKLIHMTYQIVVQ